MALDDVRMRLRDKRPLECVFLVGSGEAVAVAGEEAVPAAEPEDRIAELEGLLAEVRAQVARHDERLALVSAVKWVDELIFDTPYSMSLPCLDSIDAEYIVHGDDLAIGADGTDAYAAARAAGRMKVVNFGPVVANPLGFCRNVWSPPPGLGSLSGSEVSFS